MRNPARILPTCLRIAHAWMRVSDMRLGQLIMNCVGDTAIFYIEDDELASRVESFVKSYTSKPVDTSTKPASLTDVTNSSSGGNI